MIRRSGEGSFPLGGLMLSLPKLSPSKGEKDITRKGKRPDPEENPKPKGGTWDLRRKAPRYGVR